MRARGSADGERFTAEEIVFGTFRTVTGTIDAVEAGSVRLKEAPAPFKLLADSKVRRLAGAAAPIDSLAALELAAVKAGDPAIVVASGDTVVALLVGVKGTKPAEIGSWSLDMGVGTP